MKIKQTEYALFQYLLIPSLSYKAQGKDRLMQKVCK